jgi:hypothetical protein
MIKILKSLTRQSVAKLNPHIKKPQTKTKKMHNYFYIDANNNAIGYDDLNEIKNLINIGVIHEHTKIFNRYGKEVSRKQILTETTKQNIYNETNTKTNYNLPKTPKTPYKKTPYHRINRVRIICEILSTTSLFLGYFATLVTFIIFSYKNNATISLLILIGGLATSTYLWLLLGFSADLLKWMLNTAADLNEISRFTHDE